MEEFHLSYKTRCEGTSPSFKGRQFFSFSVWLPGPGCSKLTTSLVKMSLKFQMLISQICQYFLLKKCVKLLQCKSFSHFFNKKFQRIWLYSCKTLNKLTS